MLEIIYILIFIITFIIIIIYFNLKKKIMNYDSLTGALNRNTLSKTFDKRLKKHKHVCVCLFDLDDFKLINDNYGHNVGDLVLKEFKTFIETCFTHYDIDLFRLGGDEFLLLIYQQINQDTLKQILDEDFVLNYNNHYIETKFSTGYLPDISNKSLDTILDIADYILYENKRDSSSKFIKFLKSHEKDYYKKKSLEELLNSDYEILIFGQNIYADYNGEFENVALEVLSRVSSPYYGIIYPSEFFKYLDTIDKKIEFDLKVIDLVLNDSIKYVPYPIRLTINVHPQTIVYSKKLKTYFTKISNSKELSKRILIEITEQHLNSVNSKILNDNILEFSNMGVRFIMDDFGSEASSIYRFSEIDFSYLKFDYTMINKLSENNKLQLIIAEITKLAGKLDTITIVEGIDTIEKLKAAQELDIKLFQGYYFSKPYNIKDYQNSNYLTEEKIEELASYLFNSRPR